ncbi:MAG: ABC transporter substrate-binding protein [Planctomycetes bacterium]|nr:ABC transporter substrate-binding protein [Planctomycetota bacterium]
MNRKYSRPIISQLARYLLICFLPLILIGCGKTETGGERTLRIGGLGGPPGPINQIISNSTISVNLADLVFSALVRINERMMPEPDLAERWSVSDDGLTYTFYLRKGVRFHDNVELTAQDCAFTYNAVLNPANNSPWRENYTMIKTVKAQDRYTFTVTLNETQASFINLMNFPIHPTPKASGAGVNPVGTGPFRFVERTKDDTISIILEANPDYYECGMQNAECGVNRIEARGYDTFPEYFSAFMKGEIDMIQFLNTEQYQTIARDPAFRVYNFPSIYTYMIDYNPEHPLFKDKQVRRALAHAINIPEIINKVEGFSLSPEGRGQG